MRNLSLRPAAYLALLIVVLFARDSAGFEVDTHDAMSRKALEATEPMEFWQGYTLDDLLIDIYELPQGIGTPIGGQGLAAWLAQGSRDEDNLVDDLSLYNPLTWRFTGRFLNHFHDPTCEWDQAGLGERYNLPGASDGKSSLLWAQDPDQSGVVGSADPRSWHDARAWFEKALTLREEPDREEAWKETFRTLGHQIHLLQDLASPAHSRNDPHLIRDVFHRWAKTSPGEQALATVSPVQARASVERSLFANPSDDVNIAPIPIANAFDTTWGIGTDRFGGDIGLAEYSNANFLSDGASGLAPAGFVTTCGYYAYPNRQDAYDCPTRLVDPKTQRPRSYVCHQVDGAEVVLGTKEALMDPTYGALGLGFDGGIDENVVASYATLLFPKAIGYSAALLDYFFRPYILPQVDAYAAGSELRLWSPERLDGTVKLYYEDSAGKRTKLTEYPNVVVEANTLSNPLAFVYAPDPQVSRYAAVFQGQLGHEEGAVGVGYEIHKSRPIVDPGPVHTLVRGGSHTHEPMSAVDHQNDLDQYSVKVTCTWRGTEGSSGTVTVAQAQGAMSGGSMSIPGITFSVPQDEMFFQCCTQITVYDGQGSQGGVSAHCEPISG